MPKTPISDIGTFKSCTSGGLDRIMVKKLYCNPVSQPCTCKLLFACNEFMPIKNLEANDINAYFNRLIILPFENVKSEDEIDLMLEEKLLQERDYIFTWAMKGLKRLIENNWEFTKCKASDNALQKYMATYSPEAIFFNEYLSEDADSIVSCAEVQRMYEEFAVSQDINVKTNEIGRYITANCPNVKKERKRYNGSSNPLYVYKGLRFSE